jgi:hypothetical protein
MSAIFDLDFEFCEGGIWDNHLSVFEDTGLISFLAVDNGVEKVVDKAVTWLETTPRGAWTVWVTLSKAGTGPVRLGAALIIIIRDIVVVIILDRVVTIVDTVVFVTIADRVVTGKGKYTGVFLHC